jgi:hypothetical protein
MRQETGEPTVLSVLVAMILSRLGGISVSGMQQTGHIGMDENTPFALLCKSNGVVSNPLEY